MEAEEPWRRLTLQQIAALNPNIHWTQRSLRSKEKFFLLLQSLDPILQADLRARASAKVEDLQRLRALAKDEEKVRKLEVKRKKMVDNIMARHEKFNKVPALESYLTDVGDEIRKDILVRFIEATSNNRVRQGVCASCAGIFEEHDMEGISLSSMPHGELLHPKEAHPAQVLTHGMLLEPRGVFFRHNREYGHFCQRCVKSLRENHTPKFSLANNMWIGDIPFELQVLTVPERLLISLYYPAVYVYQLFPKTFHQGRSGFYNKKLCGNVSTYRLAPQRMADLACGNLMPRKPDVLASLVSVTLVGRNRYPERTLKGMFQLRRSRILAALMWLKANNPFYHDIHIDTEALECIPEGEVPDSISTNIRIMDDGNTESTELGTSSSKDDVLVTDDDIDEHVDDSFSTGASDIEDSDGGNNEVDAQPDIIPLNETFVVDVNGADVSPEELFYHGSRNASSSSNNAEPSYLYQHGTAFVNEYPRRDENRSLSSGDSNNPNHLLGAFPYLFPYGLGGFETKRDKNVSYAEHAAWALRYHDGRFSKNMTFISQVFNVLQKREVCRAAELQVSRRDFNKYEQLFKNITVNDLLQAAECEKKGIPVTNANVKKLRRLITTTRRHVPGTDENRQRLRSRIFGMTAMKGPPALWLTINFADTKDPLVQVFAGADIDMDDLKNTCDLSANDMVKNATENPAAATKAFFFMMKLFFEVLLGIKVSTFGQLKREMGIFGITEGYIGSIEAQGRGTLHVHLFIWLHGSPTAQRMQELLKDKEFRKRMETFISMNIRSDVEGLDEEYLKSETAKQLKSLKKMASACSRPLDPRHDGFDDIIKDFEFASARVHHVHVCTSSTCLVSKKGRIKCKRRAPWKLASHTRVYENGEWESARRLKWLNTWCLIIMLAFRCNHDIKLLTNAGLTKDAAWYMTKYAVKRQELSYNMAALLAKKYALNKAAMQKASTLRDANKKMLAQCVNTLSRYQELSSHQISAHLMGYGDRFESHTFTPIHLRFLMNCCKEYYPELKDSDYRSGRGENSNTVIEAEDETELVSLCASSSNVGLRSKTQVSDYMNRGHLLESFPFLLFMLETYESQNAVDEESARHARVPYLEADEIYEGRVRVLRNIDAEMMPDFLGTWPPRNDDPLSHEMYCCTMLALLKPWRSWDDLKGGFETWEEAFENFQRTCGERCKNIMMNFQFYYESQDTANANRDVAEAEEEERTIPSNAEPDIGQEITALHDLEDTADIEQAFEDVAPTNTKELAFGQKAVEIATQSGIFAVESDESFRGYNTASHAPAEFIHSLGEWRGIMKSDPQVDDDEIDTIDDETDVVMEEDLIETNMPVDIPAIDIQEQQHDCAVLIDEILKPLTEDQRRACYTVDRHLEAHIMGNTDQLLMLIMGAGGVGKSVVIKAIENIFNTRGATNLLAKTGTTGVAASNIEGATLHHWAGLSIARAPRNGSLRPASSAITKRRKRNIESVRYLIIDEVSMLTLQNLGILSKIIADVQDPLGENRGLPFGGKMNVILVGDFHQFPPPCMEKYALYRNEVPQGNTWAEIGLGVFSNFKTAVVLKKQMRSVDPIWSELLNRVRYCETTKDDITTLEKLTLTDPSCVKPDFTLAPWNRAVLITTRKGVREAWNQAMVKKTSTEERRTVLIIPSRNYIGRTKTALTMEQMEYNRRQESNWELPHELELFEGMRVIVTTNIAVESHLANGTMGTLEKIYLDPREPPIQEGIRYHRLKYPALFLLFRPDHYHGKKLHLLPEGLLPIEPSKTTRRIELRGRRRVIVHREQFAIMPAYAFTDYKGQGQTISPVVIDIAKPPTSRLSPFNAYVALSRSKSHEETRLLRNFDINLFTQPLDRSLAEFDELLERMDRECKEAFRGKHEYHHE